MPRKYIVLPIEEIIKTTFSTLATKTLKLQEKH